MNGDALSAILLLVTLAVVLLGGRERFAAQPPVKVVKLALVWMAIFVGLTLLVGMVL